MISVVVHRGAVGCYLCCSRSVWVLLRPLTGCVLHFDPLMSSELRILHFYLFIQW
jgi:hypothetical protein